MNLLTIGGRRPWRWAFVLLLLLGCAGEASAQGTAKPVNLNVLSLEDLMNIEITSVREKSSAWAMFPPRCT